jgi:hypothetical protein
METPVLLRTRTGRRAATAAGLLALTTTLATTAGPALGAPPDRAAAGKPGVVSLFPTDALTVPDPGQLTGRRVALPLTGCGAAITCGLVRELNELDGFDLDPRIAVRFGGAVDPTEAARSITLQGPRGVRTGVDRVVWDPATSTLYAHPVEQLAPGTTYRLRVQGGPANKAAQTVFTTMSATDGLLDLHDQIEDGSAFADAGITDRGLRVEGVFPAATTRVLYRQDRGPGDLVPETLVTPLAGSGARYVFGSYLAPSWLQDDVTIEQTPTKDDGPEPRGFERLPFIAVLPAGPAPAGGFPVAVYGHGFTRSAADVFLASVANAQAGLATIATDVVGHGYGERSQWQITSGGTTTDLPAYGRGVDQDDAGATIGNTEGSSATGAATAVGSRDALRQTVADIMTLVRSVGGTDVDTDGRADLSGRGVTYFGQSFGGIYGTMLTGVDRDVARSVLNVPGGPITEIVRLSPAFRGLTFLQLQAAGLVNSADPTRVFFQEQLPLRGDGPVVATVPGALAIQDFLAKTTWLNRPGSPETFAPLIDGRRVIIQVAYGDETVVNPTSYTIADAGDLFDRVSLYRNDKATPELPNPHGFLLQLDHPSAAQGQLQVATFLRTGRTIDPDGTGPVWEVPITDPSVLLDLNFPFPAVRP